MAVSRTKDGARTRNRTGTPLRAGDFKSAMYSFKYNRLASILHRYEKFLPRLQPFVFKGVKTIAVQNLLGRRDLFADPLTDVVLCHNDSCVPKLVASLQDVTAGFCFVGASFCA